MDRRWVDNTSPLPFGEFFSFVVLAIRVSALSPFFKVYLGHFSRSQAQLFPDRQVDNPLSHRALKSPSNNLCSNSRICSDL